jgi:hypothetical protein
MNIRKYFGKKVVKSLSMLLLMMTMLTFPAIAYAPATEAQNPVTDIICFVACKAVGGSTRDCIEFCSGNLNPH